LEASVKGYASDLDGGAENGVEERRVGVEDGFVSSSHIQ
jgi:hypothetical protein